MDDTKRFQCTVHSCWSICSKIYWLCPHPLKNSTIVPSVTYNFFKLHRPFSSCSKLMLPSVPFKGNVMTRHTTSTTHQQIKILHYWYVLYLLLSILPFVPVQTTRPYSYYLIKRPCIMSQKGYHNSQLPKRGKNSLRIRKRIVCNKIGVEIWAEAGTDLRKFVSDCQVQPQKIVLPFYTFI